jgi:hypothetical protein
MAPVYPCFPHHLLAIACSLDEEDGDEKRMTKSRLEWHNVLGPILSGLCFLAKAV